MTSIDDVAARDAGRSAVHHVLLIAAHGSSTDARAREQVQRHAARIGALVPHDETVVGFARGTPSVADVIARLAAGAADVTTHVTVLPFMTSAGHYAQQVLPRLLHDGLAQANATGVTVQTTLPVGGSRRVVAVLQRRALRRAAQERWQPRDVAILLVGHGTRRQSRSRDTALAHARALATRGWGSVQAAFIDDDPEIAPVVAAITQRQVIILPFLIGGAAHHLVDIPAALGFAPFPGTADAPGAPIVDADGRQLLLDAPLGSDDALSDIAASIAARAWQRWCMRRGRVASGAETSRAAKPGSVHLVGAGPGAADLITVRGQRAVRRADVILHDRLLSPDVLAMARPDARLIDVGKQATTPQESQTAINEALVAEALAGHRVVRLKGGDPFVFGRGTEELDACHAAGIATRVTPGLSSALAAPAAAGIPVTERHVSRSFAVVTASTDNVDTPMLDHLRAVAQADTLVVLMGHARLRAIAALLVADGRDERTPVVCIERATLPGQRIARGTLATIGDATDRAGLQAPMVIVIGATAGRGAHRSLDVEQLV